MFNILKNKKNHTISVEEIDFHSMHATSNRKELEKSIMAGCFYCKKIFKANEIDNWIPDKRGDTAACPYCKIDSVYGDASKREVTKKNLSLMNKLWF